MNFNDLVLEVEKLGYEVLISEHSLTIYEPAISKVTGKVRMFAVASSSDPRSVRCLESILNYQDND